MTAESLAKGQELQKRIAAAAAVIETIREPSTVLLYCEAGVHNEDATELPPELADLARATLVVKLEEISATLRREFELL